jgi:hypothetical protein
LLELALTRRLNEEQAWLDAHWDAETADSNPGLSDLDGYPEENLD